MRVSVLTENSAGGQFQAEHGLSYLVEYKGVKILFDTGHSDLFIQNAIKLGINLHKEVDTVVLSHGHWDHGNGLRFIENKTLITHPEAFIKRYRKGGNQNIGLALSKEELVSKFKLITSAEPFFITPEVVYLGSIPRQNDFEAQTTPFVNETGEDDFVPDDSALAIVMDDALVLISGCAHAGICNTLEYARKVTGIQKIKAVMGGFHLKQNNRQTRLTIDYFKDHQVEQVFPSHCTDLPALAAFYDAFQINQVKTGLILTF